MVGNDDDTVAVPNFGVFAKFPLKNADGARSADVVSHQYVGLDPDVVAGFNAAFAGRTSEDFLCKCHSKKVIDINVARFRASPAGLTDSTVRTDYLSHGPTSTVNQNIETNRASARLSP